MWYIWDLRAYLCRTSSISQVVLKSDNLQCNVDIVKSLVGRQSFTIRTFLLFSKYFYLKLKLGHSKSFTKSNFFAIHFLLYPRYTMIRFFRRSYEQLKSEYHCICRELNLGHRRKGRNGRFFQTFRFVGS